MSRGRIIAAVVALLVVAGIVAGVMASAKNAIPLVTVATVKSETLAVTVTASGKVEADDRADVFPPTTGIIDSVEVVDGQRVKADDVLAVMDAAPLRLQIGQARAGLAAARAQLDAVNKGVPAAIDKAAASAGVTAAWTGYKAAKDLYDALEDIYEASPPAVRESMEATVTGAKIAKQQAYAGYLSAKSGVTKLSTMSRVEIARAAANSSADSAHEALALAEDALSNATLTAPMSGIVIFNPLGAPGLDGASPKAAHGAAVGPQAAPFTIVQLGSLNFDAQVDEADVSRVEKGMTGKVQLDAFPTDTIDANVTAIRTVAVQTTTGGIAFPVLMKLNAPGKRLLIGMSGSVDIQVSAVTGAISVPIEALFDENGKKYVFVVAGGKVKKQEVTVGAMTDTQAQITSGVSVGANVAISNLSALTDGAAVRTQ